LLPDPCGSGEYNFKKVKGTDSTIRRLFIENKYFLTHSPMDEKLKQIVTTVANALVSIPPSKKEYRTIFLNKLEAELVELRSIYTLRRAHPKP